jgi:hypothetical protein
LTLEGPVGSFKCYRVEGMGHIKVSSAA